MRKNGRAGRRTDLKKPIEASRNFAKATKLDIKTLSDAEQVLFGVQCKERWKEGRKVQAKRPHYFSLHLAGKDIQSTTNCNSHTLLDDSHILVNKGNSSNEE